LVLHDVVLINEVKAGIRQISLGYDCEYFERPDGTYEQRNISINHVAILPKGRAQNAQIMDSGGSMNLEDLEQRIDRLLDLMKAGGGIDGKGMRPSTPRTKTTDETGRVLSVSETQDLMAEADRASSFAYGEACNEIGRQLRAGIPARDIENKLSRRERGDTASFETILKRYRGQGSQVNDAEENWAAALNRRGRELRERKK
jgi:hypothetical protein